MLTTDRPGPSTVGALPQHVVYLITCYWGHIIGIIAKIESCYMQTIHLHMNVAYVALIE